MELYNLKVEKNSSDCDDYQRLIGAICEKAVEDYRKGYLYEIRKFGRVVSDFEFVQYLTSHDLSVKQQYDRIKQREMMKDAEKFFNSEWFYILVPNVEGKYVIDQIQKLGTTYKPAPQIKTYSDD